MMRPVLLALLAVIGTPAAVGAHDGAGQPSCDRDGNQMQLTACAADALAAADAELNAVYRQIMAALPQGSVARANLRLAQRQWIALRDADLQAAFPLEPGEQARVMYGSMYPMSHAYAKAEMTTARTRWLRDTFLGNDG